MPVEYHIRRDGEWVTSRAKSKIVATAKLLAKQTGKTVTVYVGQGGTRIHTLGKIYPHGVIPRRGGPMEARLRAERKARRANPLPVGKYVNASVKRLANGDIQVLIKR